MSFSAWIPSETRLTPALLKPRKREASTLVGLASSEISTSGARLQFLAMASSIAATVEGNISDGVPPPRKIDVTSRPGARAAEVSISRAKALAKRSSSIG